MKKQISQTNEHASRTCGSKAGFSLVELLIVLTIAVSVAGYAVPKFVNFIHTAKLQGGGSDFASLLQVARMRAIQDGRFYSSYIIAGPPQLAYVDLKSNGGTGVDSGDPLAQIPSEVTPIAAGSAPNTSNLKGQFLPTGSTLSVKDGGSSSSPVIFSPRGLPCTTQSATGGTVCNSAGGATAFWIFFQDSSTKAWEAVTVSPAGRVQKWSYNGSNWTRI